MSRAPSFLLVAWLVAAGCSSGPTQVPAEGPTQVRAERFRENVAWLADDARAGRGTGTPGLEETADWVAARFEEAGLQPLGDDGGWLENFSVRGGRRLSPEGNSLTVGGQPLELGSEWRPLRTARSADVSGPVVFAGYGIIDADGGRDDYAGLDVKGKVVVVLRKGPRCDEPGSRYATQDAVGNPNPAVEHISFAGKVNAAFRQGAAALLVVNDPLHYPPGTPQDAPQDFTSIGGDRGSVGASLPAASLTAAAGMELGLDVSALQAALDRGETPTVTVFEGQVGDLAVRTDRPQIATANVLGFLPGSDPSGEYVLIGAHMDHLGAGSAESSRGGPGAMGQIHNGADDNASGTAGLVEVARLLGEKRGELRRGVVFAAWSGEEMGLLGSRHYADQPKLPLERLVAVINMDMIGRSTDGYVAVEGVGTSPGFSELVMAAHTALGASLDLHLAERPSDNSDQASFYDKGVPVLAFFTGLHDDYHMPSDDVEKINAQAGADIATLAGEVVRRLAMADARPVFTKPGARPAPAVAAGGTTAADPHAGVTDSAPVPYRVVFGTSPDMTYQKDDGVRISSVRANTPAEACGLKAGDLIVALDDKPVRTLEDYSALLFSHKPGDSITVTVKRGEEQLTLKAVLAGNSGPN